MNGSVGKYYLFYACLPFFAGCKNTKIKLAYFYRMETAVLIIGQGLCGTWLSYWLQQLGISFLVLDEAKPNSATRVASGVINPVTGRRMAKTWLAEELIPFAVEHYGAMGALLNRQLIQRCDIIDFFGSPDRRLDFEKKATQFAEFLEWPEDEHAWRKYLQYEMGFGIVSPCYQTDLQNMVDGWRQRLVEQQLLLEEKYEAMELVTGTSGIRYRHITAKQIIFCDGAAAAQHGFFTLLPFAPNKGEALIVDIPGLPHDHIYKKGHTLTPWKDGLFWAGSTYDNEFTDEFPSAKFRAEMEQWLKHFVKIPYTILDHLAAIRPANVERRPFAGFHPVHKNVGILNGMGAKGVTLAPFFGMQLAKGIALGEPLYAGADVNRFEKVLSRF